MFPFVFPPQFRFIDLLAHAHRGGFDPSWFDGPIELDFTRLRFAGPGAMACIKALLARAQRRQPDIRCMVTHELQDPVRYIARMDFFTDDLRWDMPGAQFDFVRRESAGRFMPIRNLRFLRETDPASLETVRCFNVPDRRIANTLQYALSELSDNALQHAGSATGAFVAAQRYPKTGEVHFTIADTGRTIRGHLVMNPKYADVATDQAAIETALRPFVTGTRIPRPGEGRLEYENQGLGLTVVDALAKRCGGRLYIWSGTALYRGGIGIETMPLAWPGTIVFLNLPSQINVNHLDLIREIDQLKVTRTKLTFGTCTPSSRSAP